MPVPEVAMPQPKTPSTLRRHPLSLAVLAACAALAPPTGAEILQFTGNAPVYTASWFNGFYTEYHEFQYFLDWQGYCNAHFGATCASTTYWGVPFNWDANRLPTATDDVRTPVGSVVVISQYDSMYKGFIPGDAFAGTLTANGKIVIGDGRLHTDSAYIADLQLGSFSGGLVNNGLVTVGNLSGGVGSLSGSGTTQVMAASAHGLGTDLRIRTGHTLEFFGHGSMGPLLEPNARLINYGTLVGATPRLNGTANFYTLPRFINRGTLTGGLNSDGVQLYNEGSVVLGDGGVMYLGPAGTHTGSFAAGAHSELTFGGPWGHELLPGSSLNSAGKVVFASGVHKVGGNYSAQETQLSGYGSNVYVSFKGPLAHMPKLHVDAGSGELRFETPAAVSIGELTLDSGSVLFDVAPGSNPRLTSTVQTLTLNGGNFNSGFFGAASTPVNVVHPLVWNAGNISGSVTALGGIEINANPLLYRGIFGQLRNQGIANWHGGVINWGGTFENLAGATFNVHGDFSAGSGGSGRFVNAGRVIKTAGSGVATLGMAFDNSGLVEAQAGTLRLTGGGTHDGGRFEALPGALIELSGSTSLKGAVTAAGRVDITGGSLTLLGGASFTNAAGNSVNVTDMNNGPGASFVSQGNLNVSGILDNQGSFTNHHASATFGSVVNAGTLINTGGLTIAGGLNSTGSFRNDGAGSRTTVSGTFSQLAGNVVNEGSLEFMGGDVAFGGTGSNLGQIYNGGGSFTVLAGASLANPGSVVNDGGTVYVQAGGVLGGSGSYVQTAGLTLVEGVLQADAGIDIQRGILRGGTPPGYSGPTAGTVIGNVSLGPMAKWQPGNSPGTFTVVGDVTVQGNGWTWPGYGNIEIEFDSPTAHDRIVVTGTLTLHEASIDLVFAPGFSALDGDSLEWLNAGNVVLPNGSGSIYFQFSGLPTGWYVTPTFGAKGMSIEFVNLAATPIPLSGPVTVAAGEQAYNDGWGSLDGLTVAGNLSNRPWGAIRTGGLAVDAGGRLINRGVIDVYTQVDNAGELINRSSGSLSHDGMLNTGSMVNEGQLSGWGFVNQGQVVNAGQFQAWTFSNLAGGRLVNTGSFYHFGQFYNEAGGRVENGGQMTADGQIVNRGEFIVSGHLQNNAWTWGPAYYTGSILNHQGGVFTVETGGTVAGPGTYFQNDWYSVTRVNGTLAASDITLREGVLTGSGTLVGPVTLGSAWGGAGAAVQPGNSPGTLTVDGNLDAYYTRFDIDLAGPSLYDRLVVTGDARFTGGVVNFILHSPDGLHYDYRPAAGDAFTWLIVGGAVQGLEGLDWNLSVVFDSGWAITVASSWGPTQWIWGPTPSDGVGIHFTGDRIEFTAAPVPEPQTWALLLAGLGLVGWMAQRRRSV
jgi:hypothetical protein